MKAVILAGGEGTRLRPYSTIFPKPLMPVGHQPILEVIIRQLKARAVTDIIVSVGYLAELIMTFFGDGSKFGVNITYSREDHPLGTAGVLGLIREQLKETFLMINGDTLTDLNVLDLVDYHKRNRADVTVSLKQREVYIDFGIAELDESSRFKKYIEKPTIPYLVSMGIYVCQPKVLEYITTGKRFDFPDLIKAMISTGDVVKGFKFNGLWLDIGRPEDFAKANDEIDEMYPKLFKNVDGQSA